LEKFSQGGTDTEKRIREKILDCLEKNSKIFSVDPRNPSLNLKEIQKQRKNLNNSVKKRDQVKINPKKSGKEAIQGEKNEKFIIVLLKAILNNLGKIFFEI